MIKSIKYELRPTARQKDLLLKTFGCCRFIYNYGLNKKSTEYKESGVKISCYDLIRELTSLKKDPRYEWLNEVPNAALQQSLIDLERAYTGFYSKKKKFPKFKKKKSKQSFRIPNKIKIDYNAHTLHVPRVGEVRFYRDKRIEGELLFATISKSPTDRYYASVTYKTGATVNHGIGCIGIDLGIRNFATTSDGEIFENQRYLQENKRKLRIEKRKLDRKWRASQGRGKNYEKQRLVVAKIYEKDANRRRDYLHKISTHLAQRYNIVCIEDLDIMGILADNRFSRQSHNIGWRQFRDMLTYKVADLRVIDRYAPTSMLCSICGNKRNKLSPSEQSWVCPSCGAHHDRDVNAAVNIREYGLRTSTPGGNVDNSIEHCQSVVKTTTRQVTKKLADRKQSINLKQRENAFTKLGDI